MFDLRAKYIQDKLEARGWFDVWIGRQMDRVFARDNTGDLNCIVINKSGAMIVTNCQNVVRNPDGVRLNLRDEGVPTPERVSEILNGVLK